jgi:hypothetical protein
MPAVNPSKPQIAMSQDAAIQEGTARVLDEALRFGCGAGLCVGDEADRMSQHQGVRRGLFG